MNAATRRRARWVVTGALAASLFVVQSPAALAHGSHHGRWQPRTASFDDQRVVELTTHGSRSRSGLAYHQTRADEVTATNAAVAYTSCDGCRAVALSFQVVVADGDPTSLDVGNLALAMNENCEGCESVAVAFQLVLASDQRLVLTRNGRQQLDTLRRELRQLARSDLPVAEIQTTAEAMMGRVATVLADELKVRPRIRCNHDVERHPVAGHGHRGHRPGGGDRA